MSIGGAITLVPGMHRRPVLTDHLLSDGRLHPPPSPWLKPRPVPTCLFVALIGWYSAGWLAPVAMLGVMIPSTTLALGCLTLGRQPQRMAQRSGLPAWHDTRYRGAAGHRLVTDAQPDHPAAR